MRKFLIFLGSSSCLEPIRTACGVSYVCVCEGERSSTPSPTRLAVQLTVTGLR